MKNPAVNFYTSDFLTGTTFMNNAQVGAYIRLLSYQHQLGHLTEEQVFSVTKDKAVLSKFKRDKKGLYFNERMEKETTKKKKYSESRARNRSNTNKKQGSETKTYEKDMKNICNSYEKHMENENIYINNTKKENRDIRGMGEEEKEEKDTDDTSLLAEISGKVISHLNEKTGSKYRTNTKSTLKHINARLNEGYSLDDFIVVIDKKYNEWQGTEFEKYLCPETLFGTKFEKYLNQKEIKPKKKESVPKWFNKKNKIEKLTIEEQEELERSLSELI